MSPLMPFPNPPARHSRSNGSPCLLEQRVSLASAGALLLVSLLFVAAGNSSAQAQTWISGVSASTTADTADITWTTAVPSDSQVEYGATAAYGNSSAPAAARVATHSVRLTGLAAGTTYHFRVRSGDGNGVLVVSQDYTLTSTATRSLALNPATLNFGKVNVNACSTAQFTTLTNNGGSAVTLKVSTLTGANVADFTWGGVGTCNTGQVLAPGASCTHSLKFCPTIAGTRSAADSVASDATGSPKAVSLSGTGTAPASSLSANPSTLTFGAVELQKCSAVQLVTLSSSSPVTLRASALTGANAADFAWGGVGTCYSGQVLGPGVSCTHSVKFCPSAAGSRSGADSVASDAPGSPTIVSLSGSGSAAAASLSVSPASLSFSGTVGTTNPSPASVSVSNTGTGALTFTGVSDQTWLAISAASGSAPSTLQVSARSSGMKAGTYTGHVNLTGGGGTKNVTVTLTLTAPVSTQHSVDLSWKTSTNAKVVSYSMYRSTNPGGSYALVASALGTASYTDQSVQSGTVYYYVVTAVDDQGRESGYSNESRATVP